MANLSNINNKFLVTTGGNVGINTTSPGQKLVVTGNIGTSGSVLFDDNQGINFGNSNAKIYGSSSDGIKFNAGGSEGMRFNQSGNLGIGITPSSTNAITTQITNGLSLFGNNTTPYGFISNNHVWATGTGDKYLVSGYGASYYKQYQGVHSWATAPSGTAGGVVTFTERMRIDSSGVVDITGGVLDMGQNRIDGSSDNLKISADNSSVSGSSTIEFLVDGSEKMRINNSGNVGIGTTAMNTTLNLYSASNTQIGFQDASTGTTSADGFRVGYNGTYGQLWLFENADFRIATNNTERLRIDSDGNVGIGTESPGTKLVIEGANDAAGTGVVEIKTTGTNLKIGGNTTYSWIQSHASKPLYINQLGNNVILNLGGGRVGIGTTSPAYSLDIDGYIGIRNITSPQLLFFETGSAYTEAMRLLRSQDKLHLTYGWNANEEAVTIVGGTGSDLGNVGIGTTSPNRKLQVAGKAIIGSTANYSSNAGTLHVYGNNSENSGMLDIMTNGNGRYYTRVCYNATTVGQAGYWHIKTNIPVNGGIMFLAKFYGYIYGSAQVLDLQHSGYAYAAGNSVINQGATNNGSNTNASSAIYASANGNKVTFRIAFGAGATFSTYFAGVYMDICFPNPAGRTHDFEIEAQTFNQSGTVY